MAKQNSYSMMELAFLSEDRMRRHREETATELAVAKRNIIWIVCACFGGSALVVVVELIRTLG